MTDKLITFYFLHSFHVSNYLISSFMQKFFATYCAKWNQSALPRPTDRNPEHTKTWIESVYVSKRFLGDGLDVELPVSPIESPAPKENGRPGSSVAGSDAEPPGSPTVLRLSDLGGTPLPKLQIGSPTKTLTPRSAAVSPVVSPLYTASASAGGSPAKKAATTTTTPREAPPPPPPKPSSPHPASPPVVPVAVPASVVTVEPVSNGLAGWDPFGGDVPDVGGGANAHHVTAGHSVESTSVSVAGSISGAHSDFGSTAPSVAASVTAAPTPEPFSAVVEPAVPAVESGFVGWAAFGEPVAPAPTSSSSSHAALENLFAAGQATAVSPAPSPIPQQYQQSVEAQQPSTTGWAASFEEQPAAVPNGTPSHGAVQPSVQQQLPQEAPQPSPQYQSQEAPLNIPVAVPAVPQPVQPMPTHAPARKEIAMVS